MSELDYESAVKQMTTAQLVKWTAGNKTGSYPRMVGELELEHRKDRDAVIRSWIAIGVSVGAFLVSLLGYLRKP